MDKDALDDALRKERESRMAKGDAMNPTSATMDLELYGSGGQEYSSTIVEEETTESSSSASARAASLAQRVIASQTRGMEGEDADGDEALKRFREAGGTLNTSKIADRDDSYKRAHRQNMTLSPERGGDAFSGAEPARGYAEILAAQQLAREKDTLLKKLQKQELDASLAARAAAQALGGGGGSVGASSASSASASAAPSAPPPAAAPGGRRRRMWDDPGTGNSSSSSSSSSSVSGVPDNNSSGGTLPPPTGVGGGGGMKGAAWDATPLLNPAGGAGDATPLLSSGAAGGGASRWDETPLISSFSSSSAPSGTAGEASVAGAGGGGGVGAARGKRSRWEETPVMPSAFGGPLLPGATPLLGSSFGGVSTNAAATAAAAAFSNNSGSGASTLLLTSTEARRERDIAARNAPLTDEALDALLPATGYRVLPPPEGYAPIRDPGKKLTAAPTPLMSGSSATDGGFIMSETPSRHSYGVPLEAGGGGSAAGDEESRPAGLPSDLPYMKPEDAPFFAALTGSAGARPAEELTPEEATARTVATLLLKVKNGSPPQRKGAMKALSEKARELGAGPLFTAILPLLMSPTLEDGERHVLCKVVERVLLVLEDGVRPYVHKILVVVEPMLIDDDYYARVEGRELIANLAKAAGLATMITVMRPDIDSPNEFHRNTTARALAVVGGALGIPAILPFLRAVTASKKSWAARHTGCKAIAQLAMLVGAGVLPHLGGLVEAVRAPLEEGTANSAAAAAVAAAAASAPGGGGGDGGGSTSGKVAMQAALALSALAEASSPYGIEAFDAVLRPLMAGVKRLRSKAWAAHIKAVGYIIPLMDAGPAAYFTKEIMPPLIREFPTPDEDMRRIVLKVLAQTAACPGVTGEYLRESVLGEFWGAFWNRRCALDRRSAKGVVDTTLALALRVGLGDVARLLCPILKDAAHTLRRMGWDGLRACLGALGGGGMGGARVEEELMDGVLYGFQELGVGDGSDAAASGGGAPLPSGPNSDSHAILATFGALLGALGTRAKPYLPQIAGVIKWRLNNANPSLRGLAAELVGRVAPSLAACGDEALLSHLGSVLYECLGEEYPEVLGSLLGGLRDCVACLGIGAVVPPVKDLLPRLTPILKNRSERVQEACIDLVGRIADKGAERVAPREWMRICFELLELLRAPRKSIRRAAVNTFGFIAKAVSPQDVLHTLLNNLKVQERTNRVCTTVAIGIIAEACAPFTVLPALMNEYRTPDMNVQNGVLKSLSFMLEYIGETARDYVYAITPLLTDALQDRDAVHRQTACACVKHLALGCAGGGGGEDALIHLLNYVWPNIFETSPHVIGAVFEAIEALRVALGPAHLAAYLRAGLFHPARRVREVYWRLYNNTTVYCGHAMVACAFKMPEGVVGGVGGGRERERGGKRGLSPPRRPLLIAGPCWSCAYKLGKGLWGWGRGRGRGEGG